MRWHTRLFSTDRVSFSQGCGPWVYILKGDFIAAGASNELAGIFWCEFKAIGLCLRILSLTYPLPKNREQGVEGAPCSIGRPASELFRAVGFVTQLTSIPRGQPFRSEGSENLGCPEFALCSEFLSDCFVLVHLPFGVTSRLSDSDLSEERLASHSAYAGAAFIGQRCVSSRPLNCFRSA